MDYFFILILWVIGVSFDVMAKVRRIRNKFPQIHFRDIWSTFFAEEWDSLFVSFIVLIAMEMALKIINYNGVTLAPWLDNWGMYVMALVLSYSGQRIAYKYLGTAEQVLSDKADRIKDQI